jgi:hypothetical protein
MPRRTKPNHVRFSAAVAGAFVFRNALILIAISIFVLMGLFLIR